MRIKPTWTFAVLAVLAASAARAADPPNAVPKPPANWDAKLNAEKTASELRDWEARRQALAKQPPVLADYLTRGVNLAGGEETVRVEQYADGLILYSIPVDKKHEDVIRKMGVFHEVEKKEQITEHSIYQGRAYLVARANGHAKTWNAALGREAAVKFETVNGARVGTFVRVK